MALKLIPSPCLSGADRADPIGQGSKKEPSGYVIISKLIGRETNNAVVALEPFACDWDYSCLPLY